MCKRAVASYNNEKRHCKSEPAAYTQGPLDEKFGQHRAFPLDGSHVGEDASVYAYLASVRKEAEADLPVHFVDRDVANAVPVERRSRVQLSPQYVEKVMERLLQAKEASLRLGQAQAEAPFGQIQLGTIELDCENLETVGADVVESGEIGVADQTEEHVPENGSAAAQTNSRSSNGEVNAFPQIPQSATQWRALVFTLGPPAQEFFHTQLEHPTVIKLIVYYTKWLLVSMPTTLAEWIFATFVRLDSGLDYTELSLVRDLGLKARKLRAKFIAGKQDGLSVPEVAQDTVDMILAVVGTYYGQRDLLVEDE